MSAGWWLVFVGGGCIMLCVVTVGGGNMGRDNMGGDNMGRDNMGVGVLCVMGMKNDEN